MTKIFLLFVIVTLVKYGDANKNLDIPEGFIIGTASSAYQIEGAWNVDDKGISVWDHFTHNYPDKIADGTNADVTTDSYNKYKEDIDILADLGVNHYRFSISWARICPHGHADYVSQSAVSHYHKILDELERRGITPFVTIYHWDHPQVIQEKIGGWLDDRMPRYYADYARVVFKHFGHRVKHFITLNELSIFCQMAYKNGKFPPALNLNGTADYLCLHNQLKANALAYHMYNNEFRKTQDGKVGIVLQCKAPFNKDSTDSNADEVAFEFECGWQAHPIFSETGDYPRIMKEHVAERSRVQGYKTSRLPEFSKEWIEYMKGTADFFGLNYYTSSLVKSLPKSAIGSWPNDEGLEYSTDPNWIQAQSKWLHIVPAGLEKLLTFIKDKYNNPPVYITENGISLSSSENDDLRIYYIQTHLKATLSAIDNGCDVRGYTYWSLLDSYEWDFGYTNQFGLMHVDFNDVNRTRTPKKSARWFKNLTRTRKLESYE